MVSPYSEQAVELVRELNLRFVAVFNLMEEYRRDDLLPNQRCGILSFRSLEPDNRHREANKNVRTGFEFQVFRVDILLTFGESRRIQAEGAAIAGMLDLQHGIAFIKQSISPRKLIYDFQVSSPIRTLMRQSIKPPHTWIVDVTCERSRLLLFIETLLANTNLKLRDILIMEQLLQLRGESYSITNTSDLLLTDLVQTLTDGARGRKGRAIIADILCTACPSIPENLASYSDEQHFTMTLDSDEIAVFTGGLTVATLKTKLDRLQNLEVESKDKARAKAKIEELKDAIRSTEEALKQAQFEILLGNVNSETFPSLDTIQQSRDRIKPTTPQEIDSEISDLETKLARLKQKPVKLT